MQIDYLLIENALLHARHTLRTSFYRKYRAGIDSHRFDFYGWAKIGWDRMGREGPYWEMIRLLRVHVPGEDLTAWWEAGRTKAEMMDLFTKAIDSLPVEVAA